MSSSGNRCLFPLGPAILGGSDGEMDLTQVVLCDALPTVSRQRVCCQCKNGTKATHWSPSGFGYCATHAHCARCKGWQWCYHAEDRRWYCACYWWYVPVAAKQTSLWVVK